MTSDLAESFRGGRRRAFACERKPDQMARTRSGGSLPSPPTRLNALYGCDEVARLESTPDPTSRDTERIPSAMLTRASKPGLFPFWFRSIPFSSPWNCSKRLRRVGGGVDRSPGCWLHDRRHSARIPLDFALGLELPGLGSPPAPNDAARIPVHILAEGIRSALRREHRDVQ